MPRVMVGESVKLQEGGRLIVQVGDLSVGVFRTTQGLRAYENVCAHQGGPACQGRVVPRVREVLDSGKRVIGQDFDLKEMHVVCPWHGAEYKIDTGEHATIPRIALRRFEVDESEGHIYVNV
ncbi:nitrite reductase [Mycobacteroides immunogenum]|uniref:Nitrite reductase n=2 Tax=Mycobacteroides immunogenum TaxID=83262 RepID=A0A7V8LJ72_9MYCO|nr:Rieske 2Fe-2S domain-containing protein [Mycobacteroides immunogenum]AMT71209.1 nitrite reductase [Mycobacteroides immunogenum]ANO04318.1 nitrite reductase [Mycobacteroides immunogenum]KIU37583.1 nitrite reductase [Mycobacteroides immunogenum]KPG02407.1 nitrite reductase [Mycobacteroides immunogenum]KPG02423.1 nitrite reductase [Mycobacteroides immunogenum]